ncbi:MAG: 4-hydroxythreonine-4-phosphate dehydrogenase PdxA [bacterium]
MKIAVSCGDVNGIGLECFFKALDMFFAKSDFADNCQIALAVAPSTLKEYAEKLHIPISINENLINYKGYQIELLVCDSEVKPEFGKVTQQSGKLAQESVLKVIDYIRRGEADAIMTLPISKEAVYLAGWGFAGHTELLGSCYNDPNPLMILFAGKLRVALVTIHSALREIPDLITQERIIETCTKFYNSLKFDFAIPNPKIAVLSLNPHAGENGTMGKEEIEIISPAIKSLNDNGISAEGPFPSDGLFAHKEFEKYDGIVSMYHDQGLTILKYIAQGGGVNFTAGLPIIRTSPDHGTAFSLAGQNIANAQSTLDALVWAFEIYKNRNL